MKKILIIAGLVLLVAGCASESLTSKSPCVSAIYYKIAEDVLSRRTTDFYLYKEKSRNTEKFVKDCDFQEVDLNNDGKAEIIVKVNWLSEGNDKFFKGYNCIRGASDNGNWYIYRVSNDNINYLGTMIDGNRWKLLSTKTNGYKD